MKQRLFSVFVLVVVVATFGFASNGDTINIGGMVPLILQLTVAPDPLADNLPMVATPAADHTQTIAGIEIVTNNTAGWELWVFPVNIVGAGGSALINADTDAIAYTIAYTGTGGGGMVLEGDGLRLGEGAAAAPLGAESAPTETGDLTVTYQQSDSHPAGYYSDQLAIVLRAK